MSDAYLDALYGDLEEAAASVANAAATEKKELEELKQRNLELEKDLDSLRKQERIWKKQRAVLVHNLGALLKTARNEIARRDRTIEQLRTQAQENGSIGHSDAR